ncbi:hypothetical protein BT96DRAFT_971110 [Gymnopus androsaceus JB14]|uniref:Uncharacterized protein n=1 Tax=Gymnopus androsaceus JB14 TaxID=1447944 RepID=A0A6A4IGC8_9AGAR|nr:hypothetical protein BT96DRAFT_971110 [Gymnopus androsaceus JB14]
MLMDQKQERSTFYGEVLRRAAELWNKSLSGGISTEPTQASTSGAESSTGKRKASGDQPELPGQQPHKKAQFSTVLSLDQAAPSSVQTPLFEAGVPMTKTGSDESASSLGGSLSTKGLVKAADSLICSVQRYKTEEEKKAGRRAEIIVFIDEAHPLTSSSGTHTRSGLSTMQKLFKLLRDRDIIVVFLSTSSKLGGLAPATDKHPSFRYDTVDRELIPPFTEFFPFDLYVKKKTSFTLSDCTELEFVAAFGRPVTTFRKITDFAQQKLSPKVKIELVAKIAWVSVLVMLKFDLAEHYSKTMSSELHRQFMHTGTPSEPVLAEAAARLIHAHAVNALDILKHAFNSGLVAKGERGEILARHLFISAQHRAALKAEETASGFTYHRPLRLLSFLEALLTEEAFKIVCEATPVDDSVNKTSLKEAFKDAYVHFSHFALAGDYKVVEISTLAKFFARGTALQCADNQRLLDIVLPSAFASSLTSPLGPGDYSVFQAQLKNRLAKRDCILDTSVTFLDGQVPERPVLSFVFELGLDPSPASTVLTPKSIRKSTRSDTPNPQSKNYQVTMMGLEGLRFDSPADCDVVKELLMPGRIFPDFPREGNLNLLMQSNPVWSAAGLHRMDWV